MTENIFLQMSALLGVVVAIAFFIRLLNQPLMVAYIVAGIVSGPLLLNLIHGDMHTYEAFAELGVVLLLFVVGLSLNFNHIKQIGKTAVISGVGQVLFTAAIGFVILSAFDGLSLVSKLYLSIAITFSSTVIITKILGDKKDMQSNYGRNVIGLMIVQDIIAVLVMVLVATVGETTSVGSVLGILVAKGILLVGVVYFLSRFLLPLILDRVASSAEYLFIFTIAWCFGVASLVHWFGFSIEIGAIVAGISLASSPYQPEIASRIKPLRDFFIVLFFLILGSQMQFAGFGKNVIVATSIALFVVIGNPIILYILFRMQKFTRRNSFLVGTTAAQVSEFGFVLLFTGFSLGHLQGPELHLFTMIALITIFISSYVITYNEQIYRLFLPMFSWFGQDRYQQIDEKIEAYDVWVFGYHRIGWRVCEALRKKNVKFAVVDFSPDAVSKLKHRGIPVFFGDAADVEFLEELPLEKAKMIISTLPEPDDQRTLVSHARQRSKKIRIIANLYHSSDLDELYNAGADYVMMPHLLGGAWIATILQEEPWTKHTFQKLRKEQRKELHLRFETSPQQ